MAFIFSGRRNEITATPPATCKPTGLRARTSGFLAWGNPFSACVEDPGDIAFAILPKIVLDRRARTSGRLPTCSLDMSFTPLSRVLTKICDDHHILIGESQGGSRGRQRTAIVTGCSRVPSNEAIVHCRSIKPIGFRRPLGPEERKRAPDSLPPTQDKRRIRPLERLHHAPVHQDRLPCHIAVGRRRKKRRYPRQFCGCPIAPQWYLLLGPSADLLDRDPLGLRR
jgi:hypothetical protein